MSFLKARLVSALAAVLLATAAFALSAGPAMASATNCSAFECTKVHGTGLHIDYLSGWLDLTNWCCAGPIKIHIELYGPKGHIKNCPQYTGDDYSGPGPTCTWSPNSNEPAGNYCSRAWQYNGGGNYSIFDYECVNVHRL
jgi:hypothetical protein